MPRLDVTILIFLLIVILSTSGVIVAITFGIIATITQALLFVIGIVLRLGKNLPYLM